jgi:hypothetical protein
MIVGQLEVLRGEEKKREKGEKEEKKRGFM